jgi:C4-dicarboxylate transporter DctM subunit
VLLENKVAVVTSAARGIEKPIAMLAVTIPILLPIIQSMEYSPIWFGVFLVLAVETGLLTPPLGIACYIVASVNKDIISLNDVFRGMVPFLIIDILFLIFLVMFRKVALFLPEHMTRQ